MESTMSDEGKSAREQLREQAATVKEDLRKFGRITREAAKDVAGEILDDGKQKFEKLEERVVTYVREKPVKSLLIAAGAGLLIGYLFSSRR